MSFKVKIRLYVARPLREAAEVILGEEQSHYLCNVMRLKEGDKLSCFNAEDGEFSAVITVAHKKQARLQTGSRIRAPRTSPDIWLLFAPLKKDRTDFVIEKAVELGASRLVPVLTRFGITDKIRAERLRAQMIEAAEQCGRLDIPELSPAVGLTELLSGWDSSRKLFFMDERGQGRPAAEAFTDFKDCPGALLIGPEGGFSEEEAAELYRQPFVCGVALGPRILRAETAAAAALSVWQAVAGDWKEQK